jgi:cellulose synthase/poly-beta-1,6-N-acetylglucosamine synthase-like glycosyltransferase
LIPSINPKTRVKNSFIKKALILYIYMETEFLHALSGVHNMSFLIYSLLLIPVTFFSIMYYLAAIRTIIKREKDILRDIKAEKLPFVTVQIPTYNEPVAVRCAQSALKFDYPKDRYEIISGDDSKDKNVMRKIDEFAKKHKNMVKVTRRGENIGFKPGNLNHMLKHSKGEIIAIFDSDFTAPKDFLKKMVRPFLKDEKVACVQAEWDFINIETNHISKLATTLLMFYYSLIVPINRKLGVSLIFGSGEAVRKDILQKLGGWKEGMLT